VEAASLAGAGGICPDVSTEALATPLMIYHGWIEDVELELRAIAEDYEVLCPGVQIETLMVPDHQYLQQLYRTRVSAGEGPDILIDSSSSMPTLAEDGLIRNVIAEIDSKFLQQFLPTAQQAMRYEGGFYGLPESINNSALLYDKNRVTAPPVLVDDLLTLASQGLGFSMPLRHNYADWGMNAFGGRLFEENSTLSPDAEGQVRWLEWLRQAGRLPNIVFTDSPSDAENRMFRGETAFVVSKPSSLARLEDRFGLENIGAALLPVGPIDISSPMLEVETVMFNPALAGERLQMAMAFGKYLVSPASQARLAGTGLHATANILVDLREWPILDTFREQAAVSTVSFETREWTSARTLLNDLYRSIVIDGANAEERVAAFRTEVQARIDAIQAEEAAKLQAALDASIGEGEVTIAPVVTPIPGGLP
jgi:maltose-binding protein MalE